MCKSESCSPAELTSGALPLLAQAQRQLDTHTSVSWHCPSWEEDSYCKVGLVVGLNLVAPSANAGAVPAGRYRLALPVLGKGLLFFAAKAGCYFDELLLPNVQSRLAPE